MRNTWSPYQGIAPSMPICVTYHIRCSRAELPSGSEVKPAQSAEVFTVWQYLSASICEPNCSFYGPRVREQLKIASNDAVGVSELSHWHTAVALRRSPAPPGFGLKNGPIRTYAGPCIEAPRLTWGEGFWECSPSLNVRWRPFQRGNLGKSQCYPYVFE